MHGQQGYKIMKEECKISAAAASARSGRLENSRTQPPTIRLHIGRTGR